MKPPKSSPESPLVTADLPGSGGAMVELEDFRVEEIPAYLPSGAGEHCMMLVEKRDLTTPEAIKRLCAGLGLDRATAGYAGLKDRHAVTRQWISIQRADPVQARRFATDELRVLEAGLHGNKLRTGHLRGNRFRVVLRGVEPDGYRRAEAVLERLTVAGLPNFFGPQRFGRAGDNAEQGLRLLRGELRIRDRQRRRLLVSALQSLLFNQVLARRVLDGSTTRLVGGEVLQRTDSGGVFVSEAPETDGPRLDAGEVVITGPICGPRMPLPAEGSPARALEEQVFHDNDVSPDQFSAVGRIGRGGRRGLTVPVRDATVRAIPEGLQLDFVLPPGTYATVLLREVTKGDPRTR